MNRSLMRKAVEGKSLTLPKGVHDGFLPVNKKKKNNFTTRPLHIQYCRSGTVAPPLLGDIDT